MEILTLQPTKPTPLSKAAKLAELRRKQALVKVSEPKLRVLSLGWGVQSFTLAAMSALGELPKLDVLIHADTSWERQHTYEFENRWLPWFEAKGILVISACALAARHPERNKTQVNIPAIARNNRGEIMRINRQCTGRWKIDVIKQLIRQELELRGIAKTPGVVEQWVGISWDEANRASSSDVKYIRLRYPFLEPEYRHTRTQCIQHLERLGLEVPKQSSCFHCGYRSDEGWIDMKRENSQTGNTDFPNAVIFDRTIRPKSTKYGELFIHRSARPLDTAVRLPEEEGYLPPAKLIDGPGCDRAGYCWD